MSSLSTAWLIIMAVIFAGGFTLVMNSDMAGAVRVAAMIVFGVAALACFALLVAKAAGRLNG